MKKSMLALAVLGAFAGTAAAQTSVTLYGIADVNVVFSKAGDNAPINDDWRTLVRDGGGVGGKGGSRWGLRISEDLGGGLRAYAVLEQGFNLDDGSPSSTRQFHRQAYVALGSKTLGDLRVGRQESISRILQAYLDPSDKGQIKTDESGLFEVFGSRTDNTVAYLTPNFGGFQVSVNVGAGEGATARYQGISGTFRSGPIQLGLGYEEYDGFGETYNSTFTIGGNYNFGFAKLFAGYQMTDEPGGNAAAPSGAVDDRDVYTVGVSVPIGQITVLANYSHASNDLSGGGDTDLEKAGIAVEYSLSKRTMVYSAYTYRGGDLSSTSTTQQEFTLLGLRHVF